MAKNRWQHRLKLAWMALRGADLTSYITIRKDSKLEDVPNPGVDPIPVHKLRVTMEVNANHGLHVRWVEEGDIADEWENRPYTVLRAGDKLQLNVEQWGQLNG